MTYETMESKILAIVEANRDRVYKEKIWMLIYLNI